MDSSTTVITVENLVDNVINPKIVRWFEGRGISHGNIEAMGIYSGRHQQNGDSFEIVPDSSGEIIVFPYKRHGVTRNEKYRGAHKKFYQQPGGKKLFWNADVLDDPALHEGRAALVITEGEMDVLSVMEAGNPFVVSVPDGAPPPREEMESIDDIDPVHDDKYRYILNDWESLKKIKRIVIAGDSDAPGKQLGEELVRRLGRARCSFVEYPEDCKDFNEVLLKYGPAAVATLVAKAKPYPVSGIYTYSDLPPEPDLHPVSTGFGRLDHYLMPFYPSLMVVTGIASMGKSTFVNQMVAQMNLLHGWRAGIASFEMRIKPFVTNTLTKTYEKFGRNPAEVESWLEKNFVFIAPEPSEENDQFDIDWLIEKATTAVIRHGIRVLVIDPWNEIEHGIGRRESLTEYTGRAIRALKRFGREFEVMVVVVAHPNKNAALRVLTASEEDVAEISLYDVSDSAHWANKADFGVVVTRRGLSAQDYVTQVAIKKVRYQPISGRPGFIDVSYDPESGTFSQ